MEVECFCEPPFFISRTFYSSTLGFVFRQTEAVEHFSLFRSQRDGPPMVCVTWIPSLLIDEWVDSMEWRVKHGWISFVAMWPLSSLSLNAPTGQPYWHCEGAISYSVRMSETPSVISYKSAIIGNYMSWSDDKRYTKTLKMLNNTYTRITQATKWACWDIGLHVKCASLKSWQILFTKVIYDREINYK